MDGQDVVLGAAGAQIHRAVLAGDFLEAPDGAIEFSGFFEIENVEFDAPQVGHAWSSHCGLLSVRAFAQILYRSFELRHFRVAAIAAKAGAHPPLEPSQGGDDGHER